MFEDLTIITCSYNTPHVFELCLKSFVFHHGEGPHKIVVIDNSTNPDTQLMLDHNKIHYIRNPGGTHSPAVDLGLEQVKTRFALLLDTDIIFHQNIESVFYFFKRYDLTLLGELQGDRGQYQLFPRVAPYFCFINAENIQRSHIRFHDEERIKRTGSEGFFKNMPIQEKGGQRYYDVGSIFFEDIKKNNFLVANLENIGSLVFHAESLSWTLQSGIEVYEKMGKQREVDFYHAGEPYKDVRISNCFC